MNELNTDHIERVLNAFLSERFDIPPDELKPQTAVRDFGVDSMMMLEVMLEAEDRLGVKLTDLSLPANPTLRDVANLVMRNSKSGVIA